MCRMFLIVQFHEGFKLFSRFLSPKEEKGSSLSKEECKFRWLPNNRTPAKRGWGNQRSCWLWGLTLLALQPLISLAGCEALALAILASGKPLSFSKNPKFQSHHLLIIQLIGTREQLHKASVTQKYICITEGCLYARMRGWWHLLGKSQQHTLLHALKCLLPSAAINADCGQGMALQMLWDESSQYFLPFDYHWLPALQPNIWRTVLSLTPL